MINYLYLSNYYYYYLSECVEYSPNGPGDQGLILGRVRIIKYGSK